MRKRIGRVKVRNLMGGDKESLIGKAKAVQASKANQGIHSPVLITGRCSASSRRAGLHHV